MRELCDEFDALMIADEVQTGCGITGTAWAYQQLGFAPTSWRSARRPRCGVMAGRRVDEVADNVHRQLADQLHLGRQPGGHGPLAAHPEVVEADGLSRTPRGWARSRTMLDALALELPDPCTTSGRGLMCAFSLPTTAQRDAPLTALWGTRRDHVSAAGRTRSGSARR